MDRSWPSFREYGFDDVLPKPWAVVQLSEVFRRVLMADAEGEPPQSRTSGRQSGEVPPG